MPRSLAVLQYALPLEKSTTPATGADVLVEVKPTSTPKNAYIVPELLYLGQALERNWDTFAKKMQKALEKKQIEPSDLRALQDAFVLLWHRQGAFQFNTPEEARQYTQNLYALMTRAQLHLPPEISGAKVDQYVANIKAADAFVWKPAPGLGPLSIDVGVYRNKLQKWAPKLWTYFVALTVAAAGGAVLALSLVTGGWPLALVVVAVVSWATFTLFEKEDGSFSRTSLFVDMLARNHSGLYNNMKKLSPKNLSLSAFVIGVLGLAIFAPMVGMIASGLAAFGLVAFMVISVVANGYHNNASLLNVARKFLEKHIKWFRFGATDIKKDAMPDMQQIKDKFVPPVKPEEDASSEPAVSQPVVVADLVAGNIQFMTSEKHIASKMNVTDADAKEKKKVLQAFTADPVVAFKKSDLAADEATYEMKAVTKLESSAPSLRFALASAREESITVEKYEPKVKVRAAM